MPVATIRAIHGDVVTFHGLNSGYRVPPELEPVMREAITKGWPVRFRASTNRILSAEPAQSPTRPLR